MRLARVCVFILAAMATVRALAAQDHGYTPADIENGGRAVSIDLRRLSRPERRRRRRHRSGARAVSPRHVRYRPHQDHPDRHSGHDDAAAQLHRQRGGHRGGVPPEHGDGPHAARRPTCFAASAMRRAARRSSKARGSARRAIASTETGPRLAPDLSEVGATRPLPELHQALLDPNATMRAGNRFVPGGHQGRRDDHRAAAESGQLFDSAARRQRAAGLAAEDRICASTASSGPRRCRRFATN